VTMETKVFIMYSVQFFFFNSCTSIDWVFEATFQKLVMSWIDCVVARYGYFERQIFS